MHLCVCFIIVCLANVEAKSISETHPIKLLWSENVYTNESEITSVAAVSGDNYEGPGTETIEKGDTKCAKGQGLVPEYLFDKEYCKVCHCRKDNNCTFTKTRLSEISAIIRKTCLCEDGYEDKEGECIGTCQKNPCQNEGDCIVEREDIKCNCKNQFAGSRCEAMCDTDCGSDAECKVDPPILTAVCACKESGLTFDKESKRCKAICDTDCGRYAECELDTSTSTTECICKMPGLTFDKESKMCKAICDADCGRYARCEVDLSTSTTECACKMPGLTFDKENRTCNAICDADCGRHAKCEVDLSTSTTVCACKIPGLTFDKQSKTCNVKDGTEIPLSTKVLTTFIGPETESPTSAVVSVITTDFPTDTDTTTDEIDACVIKPCKNGGICKMEQKEFVCYCPSPFTGKYCEIDPCSNNPCHNGGTCLVDGSSFQCICRDPFTGSTCEANPCMWNPCKNGGVCKLVNKSARCFCDTPYTGEFCDSVKGTGLTFIMLVIVTSLLIAIAILVSCILCQRVRRSMAQKQVELD